MRSLSPLAVALLVLVSGCTSPSDVRPGPTVPAPTSPTAASGGEGPWQPAPASAEEEQTVRDALAEMHGRLEAARDLRTRVEADVEAVREQAVALITDAGTLLGILSRLGWHAEANALAEAVVGLRNLLGPTVFPIASADAFVRDDVVVGAYRLIGAQFFELTPFYPNDPEPMIWKAYRYSVYVGDRVVARYYLEHSAIDENELWVVGLSSPSGHAQLGASATRPPFHAVREVVLRHVASGELDSALRGIR